MPAYRHSSCFCKYVCKFRYFHKSWNIYPFQGDFFPTSPLGSHPCFWIQDSEWWILFCFLSPLLPSNFHMTCPSFNSSVNNPSKRQFNFLSPPQTWSRSSDWVHVSNQKVGQPASLPPVLVSTHKTVYCHDTKHHNLNLKKTWLNAMEWI